jgi:hypothetical protein
MAIHTTAGSFNSAFSKLIKASEKKVEEVVKDVAVDLVVNLVVRSPVDSGRFRKNWNVAINEINYQTDFEVQNTAVQRSVKVVENYRLGDTINITNSLPYAARLEYEGWSKQAPDGMVMLTLLEYPQIMRRRAQKVAK